MVTARCVSTSVAQLVWRGAAWQPMRWCVRHFDNLLLRQVWGTEWEVTTLNFTPSACGFAVDRWRSYTIAHRKSSDMDLQPAANYKFAPDVLAKLLHRQLVATCSIYLMADEQMILEHRCMHCPEATRHVAKRRRYCTRDLMCFGDLYRLSEWQQAVENKISEQGSADLQEACRSVK